MSCYQRTRVLTIACLVGVISSFLSMQAWGVEPFAVQAKKQKGVNARVNAATKKDDGKPLAPPEPIVRLPKTKVQLPGGEVEVDEFGETYQAYDWKEPIRANDWVPLDAKDMSKGFHKTDPRIETVVDYMEIKTLTSRPKANIEALVIDPEKGWMYWVDRDGQEQSALFRARLDGSDVKQLGGGLNHSLALALDSIHGKLYFHSHRKMCRINVDGTELEDLYDGLDQPMGIAVDGASDLLLLSEQESSGGRRLFQSRLDGSGRKLTSRDMSGLSLAIDTKNQKLFWGGFHGETRVSNLDGSNAVSALTGVVVNPSDVASRRLTGEVWSFKFDEVSGYFYYRDHTYRKVCRVPNGGGFIEDLIHDVRDWGCIAIDAPHSHLYFTDKKDDAPNFGFARIRRIRIPDYPRPAERISPAVILAVSPMNPQVGSVVEVTGSGFTGTKEVSLFGVGIGDCLKAEFKVISDSELSITLPKFRRDVREIAIVVIGPGGAAVTLPKDSLVIDEQKSKPIYKFAPWEESTQFSMAVSSNSRITDVERALAYVADGGYASVRGQGKSLALLKNGACFTFGSRSIGGMVIQEPFAVIHGREQAMDMTQIVHVPAIRPSFVDRLPKLSNAVE